jgi:outer membrane protein insertion porin family
MSHAQLERLGRLIAIASILWLWLACGFCQAQFGNPFGGGSGGGGGGGGGAGAGIPAGKKEHRPEIIPYIGPQEKIPVAELHIIGNRAVHENKIRSMLGTREGRVYDAEQVRRDMRALMQSGYFTAQSRTYKKQTEAGMVVTYELFERPLIGYVRFIGNEKIRDKKLLQEAGIKVGDPLNRFSVEESKRRIEDFYKSKGYNDVFVSVVEGLKTEDAGVTFRINEGRVLRISQTTFEGNHIASDARLKTVIKSKPGILWLIGGKAKDENLEQDTDRLTAYYRSLGYFRARVGRNLQYNDSRTWLGVHFIIDEGPRYRVNDVRLVGTESVPAGNLVPQLTLRKGDYYNLSLLQRDLNMLRDEYGGRGYILADVKAEPTFHEQPGLLDLVYSIDEGQQYRVGDIQVNIDGGESQTRRNVVLNYLSIRPGDVVDVREIRRSERLLQASELFLFDPSRGQAPRIVVKPRDEDQQMANEVDGTTVRGQTPYVARKPVCDLQVVLPAGDRQGETR